MAETQDPAAKTYRGNCHCGAFVYEVTVPEIKLVHSCNCSHCSKKACLWVPVLDLEAFKPVVGSEDDLAVYQFGPKNTDHKFCPTCGSGLLARLRGGSPGRELLFNARCIQGLNIWDTPVNNFPGKNTDPQYEVPEFKGQEPSSDADGETLYHGSCHCGAVTVAVQSPPLDENFQGNVVDCNCSSCQRNGYLWIYPTLNKVGFAGKENLTQYAMGRKIFSKPFCKFCGIPMTNVPIPVSDEKFESLSPEFQAFYKHAASITPVNIRTFNNFDVNAVKPHKMDGFNATLPRYINP
ncbi:hypothetical protein G7046_g9995 [Stylonectria norvegica]|nr:hypothetical protein G7046_g9995 [Stylonectria norvegica]